MGNDTVRVHRLTGCMDQATSNGWQRLPNDSETCMTPEQRVRKAEATAQAAKDKAAAAAFAPAYQAGKQQLLQALEKNASGQLVLGVFNVELYNPTRCKLLSLTINLGGRTYTQNTFNDGQPNASSRVEFIVYDGQGADTDSWNFEDVSYETSDSSVVGGVPTCVSNISAAGG